jgi:hypothetical protein
MSQLKSRTLFVAAVALFSASAAVAETTAFDGNWSVVFATRAGHCDPTYRLDGEVSNGAVRFSGGGNNYNGRVTPNGSITMTVSTDAIHGSGSGRLTRASGAGSWRARINNENCSGVWTAQRS